MGKTTDKSLISTRARRLHVPLMALVALGTGVSLAEHGAGALRRAVAPGRTAPVSYYDVDTGGVNRCRRLDWEYTSDRLRYHFLFHRYLDPKAAITAEERTAAQIVELAIETREKAIREEATTAMNGEACNRVDPAHLTWPWNRPPADRQLLEQAITWFPDCANPCQFVDDLKVNDPTAQRRQVLRPGTTCVRCYAARQGMSHDTSTQCRTEADAGAAAFASCALGSSHPLSSGCGVSRCTPVTEVIALHQSGRGKVQYGKTDTTIKTESTGLTLYFPVRTPGGLQISGREETVWQGKLIGHVELESGGDGGAVVCQVGGTDCAAHRTITCTATHAQGKFTTRNQEWDFYGNGVVDTGSIGLDVTAQTQMTFETGAGIDLKSAMDICGRWLDKLAKHELKTILQTQLDRAGAYWRDQATECLVDQHCFQDERKLDEALAAIREKSATVADRVHQSSYIGRSQFAPTCRSGKCFLLGKHGANCREVNPSVFPTYRAANDRCLSGSCRQDTLESLTGPAVFKCFGPFIGERIAEARAIRGGFLASTSPQNKETCFDRHTDLDQSEKGLVYAHPCHRGDNQRFRTIPTKGAFLIVADNGACLDVHTSDRMGPGDKGYKVYLNTQCHAQPNQLFQFFTDGTIRDLWSGQCLDVSEKGLGGGNQVYMYPCHQRANQRWEWRM